MTGPDHAGQTYFPGRLQRDVLFLLVVHRRLELAETDILAGLAPASLAATERRVRTIAVPAGEAMFRAGDPS